MKDATNTVADLGGHRFLPEPEGTTEGAPLSGVIPSEHSEHLAGAEEVFAQVVERLSVRRDEVPHSRLRYPASSLTGVEKLSRHDHLFAANPAVGPRAESGVVGLAQMCAALESHVGAVGVSISGQIETGRAV